MIDLGEWGRIGAKKLLKTLIQEQEDDLHKLNGHTIYLEIVFFFCTFLSMFFPNITLEISLSHLTCVRVIFPKIYIFNIYINI